MEQIVARHMTTPARTEMSVHFQRQGLFSNFIGFVHLVVLEAQLFVSARYYREEKNGLRTIDLLPSLLSPLF